MTSIYSQKVNQTVQSSSHAILVTGSRNLGKKHFAKTVANTMMSQNGSSFPIIEISPDKLSVNIEQIRNLQRQLKLKSSLNRVVIIYDADKMTLEAQNALLKTLEEPPIGVTILLTSSAPYRLIDTIRSRVQTVQINPLSPKKVAEELKLYPDDRSIILSQGKIGLANKIHTNQDQTDTLIKNAKEFAVADLGKRSIIISKVKSLDDFLNLLEGLQMISVAALNSSIQKQAHSKTRIWLKLYDSAHKAESILQTNGNLKLVSLKLLSDSSL